MNVRFLRVVDYCGVDGNALKFYIPEPEMHVFMSPPIIKCLSLHFYVKVCRDLFICYTYSMFLYFFELKCPLTNMYLSVTMKFVSLFQFRF